MTYDDLIRAIETAVHFDMGAICPSLAGVSPLECVCQAIVCWLGVCAITGGRG